MYHQHVLWCEITCREIAKHDFASPHVRTLSVKLKWMAYHEIEYHDKLPARTILFSVLITMCFS